MPVTTLARSVDACLQLRVESVEQTRRQPRSELRSHCEIGLRGSLKLKAKPHFLTHGAQRRVSPSCCIWL